MSKMATARRRHINQSIAIDLVEISGRISSSIFSSTCIPQVHIYIQVHIFPVSLSCIFFVASMPMTRLDASTFQSPALGFEHLDDGAVCRPQQLAQRLR